MITQQGKFTLIWVLVFLAFASVVTVTVIETRQKAVARQKLAESNYQRGFEEGQRRCK